MTLATHNATGGSVGLLLGVSQRLLGLGAAFLVSRALHRQRLGRGRRLLTTPLGQLLVLGSCMLELLSVLVEMLVAATRNRGSPNGGNILLPLSMMSPI